MEVQPDHLQVALPIEAPPSGHAGRVPDARALVQREPLLEHAAQGHEVRALGDLLPLRVEAAALRLALRLRPHRLLARGSAGVCQASAAAMGTRRAGRGGGAGARQELVVLELAEALRQIGRAHV